MVRLQEDDLPDTLEGNELDEERLKLGIPTLHKLKSVSAELHEFNNKADEDLMINDNKIPSDDDHDHEAARQRVNNANLNSDDL